MIKHGDLVLANLGDGRCVASCAGQGGGRQLSQDHNTSNPRERERVTAMGGAIKENRVGGVLIPTRYFIHPKFLNDWGILNVTGVSETFY